MRLSKLLVALAVTVGAFALFGANARVAMASDAAPSAPCTVAGTVDIGTVTSKTPFCVHINEPRATDGTAIFCRDHTADPDMNASEPPEARSQTCGHVLFNVTGPGTLTGSITYPEAPMNLFTLHFCLLDTVTGSVCTQYFDDQTAPLQCQFSGPTGTGNVTVTLTCGNLPAGSYELIVNPFFFDSCADVFDLLMNPQCPSFAGIGIQGSVSFQAQNASGSGGGGNGNSARKVTGGGKILDATTGKGVAEFAIDGVDQVNKGHIRLSIKGSCSIKADNPFTTVDSPSHAKLTTMTAYVKSASFTGTTQVTVDAYDFGEGKSAPPDHITFTVPAASACNIDGSVSGNIQIHYF